MTRILLDLNALLEHVGLRQLPTLSEWQSPFIWRRWTWQPPFFVNSDSDNLMTNFIRRNFHYENNISSRC
ncbi:hypothetical protein THIOM_003025 [Candidatus Thiomargarita nelsonii]|uniref:Uncharacterized protein n=1 Tax=Candidatus Thiomargarita nelsonii TaxID=1003181 RepID=A0A176RZI5_9GAMM|nr:hypothetical protein THIOM_003025 [Candidatus Thiomargarita nelsonii]